MNDSPRLMKWFYRAVLAVSVLLMSYVVTRPAYNFAHWVPHNYLQQLGVSHQAMLWGERNADVALHFLGGASLTSLIYLARLPFIGTTAFRAFLSIICLCIGAELFQMSIGRGYQTGDLLLGIMGGFMAYLLIEKNKQTSK